MKKEFETAIDEFVAAEKDYKELEEKFMSGEAMLEIVDRHGNDRETMLREFQSMIEAMQNKIEDVNVKLRTAKNAFRQVAQLAPTQQRGPEGRGSTFSYGPLTVQSATRRWLDAESLLRLAARYGILDRLLSLTSFDKNGKEYRLVEQTWKVDYENVLKWLREQGLTQLINGSYDEREETPRVSGAKPLAFLGEEIDKP